MKNDRIPPHPCPVKPPPNMPEPRKETLEAENARLKAEVERLTEAGDSLVYSLQWCDWGSHIQTMDSVNRWNAAKEGKQS
jgi:hypothetical protein